MSVEKLDELFERLKELRCEHRELDLKIAALTDKAYQDQITLQRLKKRKLSLKDQIVRLESELIPDLNA